MSFGLNPTGAVLLEEVTEKYEREVRDLHNNGSIQNTLCMFVTLQEWLYDCDMICSMTKRSACVPSRDDAKYNLLLIGMLYDKTGLAVNRVNRQ